MVYDILTQRYGNPSVVKINDVIEHCWNEHDERTRCTLYMAAPNESLLLNGAPELRQIYGRYIGGFLIGDSIKIAAIVPREIYGLYNIDELRTQPEVQIALGIDSSIHFFMDASNTWFYGEKEQHLMVFDCETEELNDLGGIREAIETLIDEWVVA